MDVIELINIGNQHREENHPELSLACYATIIAQHPDCAAAWCNYGNVIRECGYPEASIPFLQKAIELDPNLNTAQFNLAVSYLITGDYKRGWAQYETRWRFEHLDGMLPNYGKPMWNGEDLRGKSILIMGEQGHGDNIQFIRFAYNLHLMGARIFLQITDGLVPLMKTYPMFSWVGLYNEMPASDFDYWIPIMSIARVLNIRVDNIPQTLGYLEAPRESKDQWFKLLGPKHKMRVGFCYSGRRDTWINRYKAVKFEEMVRLIKLNPDIEWINLQADASDNDVKVLSGLGVRMFPGAISSFADTAGLMMNLDLVIGMDTAVSHMAGALGRPLWVLLSQHALDWRWLLDREDSPWYPSARLFRQPKRDDWTSVIDRVHNYLKYYKL